MAHSELVAERLERPRFPAVLALAAILAGGGVSSALATLVVAAC